MRNVPCGAKVEGQEAMADLMPDHATYENRMCKESMAASMPERAIDLRVGRVVRFLNEGIEID